MRKDKRRQIVRDIVNVAKGSDSSAVRIAAIIALVRLAQLWINRPTDK